MSENDRETKDDKVFIKANKPLFLERYFSYFSDKYRKDLINKIKTRQVY